MKKYILVTVLISSLLLASCGKKETVENPSKVDKTVATQETTGEKTVESTESEQASEEKVNSTMKEIYKKGKPTTCTFKINGEDGSVYDSIMYIDGKVLRYVMKGEIEGQKLESNVLIKDGYSYSWSNMAPSGFKMKEDLNEETKEEGNEMETKEMNETLEFNCKKGVDSAMFDLPKDIKFQEFDMAKIPTTEPTINCEGLPGCTKTSKN